MTSSPAPRAASTVLLCRPTASTVPGESFEIYMVKRHGLSDVLGGAFVFPGGKLDAADDDVALTHLTDHACARADETTWSSAVFAAAIRETFEEAGVLVGLRGAAAAAAQATLDQLTHLTRDAAAPLPFAAALKQLVITLDATDLLPWVRWVTPLAAPKRFDARFFLARMPAGQTPIADVRETTEGRWITPAEALHLFEHGADDEFPLAPPTYKSIEDLARAASLDALFAQHHCGTPRIVIPLLTANENGEKLLALPGDPLHPDKKAALGGATRLLWQGKRFASIIPASMRS